MESDVAVVKKKVLILMIDYYSGLMLMSIMEYANIVKMLEKYLLLWCAEIVEVKAYLKLNL